MLLTQPGQNRVHEKFGLIRRLESWQWAVVLAAAIALGCKILLALKTYGTNDVYSFEQTLEWWRYFGADLYRATPGANNPPSMLYWMASLRWLAQHTGLAFSFWVHVPAILADLGDLWLVWRILEPRLGERSIRWALVLMAAAPASVLISGFHGQNDSVMIFFLLLSTYLVEKGRPATGGVAFGLAMCVKVVPVIAVPALFFYQLARRRWIVFFAAAGAVVLAAWAPFLLRGPRAVLTDLFGYSSILGTWGLTYLALQLHSVSRVGTWLCVAIQAIGSRVLLLAIAGLSWKMNRCAIRPSLDSQLGFVFFLFLAGTSGFGVQYLAWLVPWVVGLGCAPAALYGATSGIFLFLTYDFWSQGMPWYLADSNRVGNYYYGGFAYFHIVCWLTVVALVWTSWRQMWGGGAWELTLARMAAPRRRVALVLASLLLLVPMARWLQSRHAAWASQAPLGADALTDARKRYLLDLASHLHSMGRTQDSAEVAKCALAGGREPLP